MDSGTVSVCRLTASWLNRTYGITRRGFPTQGCEVDPDPESKIRFTRGTLTLSRFRRPLQSTRWASSAPTVLRNYQPPEESCPCPSHQLWGTIPA